MHPWNRYVSYTTVLQALMASTVGRLTLEEVAEQNTKLTPGGIHLPIVKLAKQTTLHTKGTIIGLGDAYDV
jgi:hypothetical protein